MFVLGLRFRLRQAIPGWGSGVCVFVWPLRLHSACPGCGVWYVGWVLPGTCSRAVVLCVLCALSGLPAPAGRCCLAPAHVPWLWPAVCLSGVRHGPAWCAAPPLVWSLLVLRSAFRTPWCLSPAEGAFASGFTERLRGARRGLPGTGLLVPAACPCRGRGAGLAPCCTRFLGLAMGLSRAGPSTVGLGQQALQWFACADQVTDASGFPYCLSFNGGFGRCTRAVLCGRRHRPFRVRGGHNRVLCVCACAGSSLPGWAGRRPGRVLVRLTFSCGRSRSSLCLLGPHPGWECPVCGCCCLLSFPSARRQCLLRSVFWDLGCLGPWRLVAPPGRPPGFLSGPRFPPLCIFLFFLPALLVFSFCCLRLFFSCGASSCRVLLVLRCWGDLRVLGCGVCFAVGVVPWRGPVSSCAVLFGGRWLCLFSGCCCLSCCVCPMAP